MNYDYDESYCLGEYLFMCYFSGVGCDFEEFEQRYKAKKVDDTVFINGFIEKGEQHLSADAVNSMFKKAEQYVLGL